MVRRTKYNEHGDRWQIVQNKRGNVGFLNQRCRWEMATSLPIDGRDGNCAHIACILPLTCFWSKDEILVDSWLYFPIIKWDNGWLGATFCCILNWHLIVIRMVKVKFLQCFLSYPFA